MGTDNWLVCLVALLLCVHPGECTEIIGGKEVAPHSLPYMALLEGSNGSFCGGTLIDLKWVLTAAHCKNVQKVQLGVHSYSKPEKGKRQTRKVAKVFTHPCYDADSKVNDLMLLKLDKEAKITGAVRPLPLSPPTQDVPVGVVCTIAGWGFTNNRGNKMSDVLLWANVTVIGRDVCNDKAHYDLNPVITRDMLCAGFDDKRRTDTCTGDSGGPLVCQGIIRGVTSFGRGCGIKTKPGVYTALSKKHTEWIRKTTKT